MRAADFLVHSLTAHGIERIYCVPGESYLALLDALYGSDILIVVCRHEGGAGFMACAEAKLTGKPAVFMVSRGPGATNGSIAIHMADQDALPVIMLIGQVSREERTRGVFQEVDYNAFFGSMAKAVYEVNDGGRLPELLPRAIRLAREGVPGPVIFSLPEDMLHDDVGEPDVLVYPPTRIAAGSGALNEIQQAIMAAERPLVIAGGALRSTAGTAALARFAEAQRLPVAVTWKNQDVFDNGSSLYAGHLGFGVTKAFGDVLRDADLIIAIGTRLGDVASLGYTLPRAPQPTQTLIHIYPDGKPLGRVFNTDIALVADPVLVLSALAGEARVATSQRESWISKLNGSVLAQRAFVQRDMPDGINFGDVVMALQKHAPVDAILTTDSGNGPTWLHRHYVMSPRNTLLGGIVGAMGLGVPAATMAAIVQPQRMAICIVGDGGVLMTGQELATAMAYDAAPKIIISDNGIYGTIRTHQEREYPGRVSGTNLSNPDFAAWARSFGATAFTLAKGDDVDGVMAAFLKTSADLKIPDIQLLFHGGPLGAAPYVTKPYVDGFACIVALLRPESRGQVELASSDPARAPRIRQNFLTKGGDWEMLKKGIRLAGEISKQQSLEKFMEKNLMQPDVDAHIRATSITVHHPLGTCAMGEVVDEALKVRGAQGLRVVDASVMPDLVGGNINAAVTMIAERAADLIRGR